MKQKITVEEARRKKRQENYDSFHEYIMALPDCKILTLDNAFLLIKNQKEIFWTSISYGLHYSKGGHVRCNDGIHDQTHRKKDYQLLWEVVSGENINTATLIDDVFCFGDKSHPIHYVEKSNDPDNYATEELQRMSLKLEEP